MASAAQVKEFIARIAPIIQEEAKERGYLVCSPIIAQAIIESGADTSLLAYKFHNYFGMKCGSSWKGTSVNLRTKEEVNSTLISIRDNFRTYPDMISGVKGYFDFISTKRYANLKTARTPEEYLRKIKEDGYATSSSYVNTNMAAVNKYDLTKYDTFLPVSAKDDTNPYEEPKRLLKRGTKGEDVKWVQWELTQRGLNVGSIDGIYGQKTYSAVCIFQKNCDGRLAIDGIVGKKTIAEMKKG